MAKISISDVLRSRRRFRVVTILACLLLFVVLGEMIISQSPRKANASTYTLAGWTINTTAHTCVGSGSSTYFPAVCGPDYTVTTHGGTINADTVGVWQKDGTHYECVYAPGGGYYLSYFSENDNVCHYTKASTPLTQVIHPADNANCPATYNYGGNTYAFEKSWNSAGGLWGYYLQCQYVYTPAAQNYIMQGQLTYHYNGVQCLASFTPKMLNSLYTAAYNQMSDCDTKRHFASLTLNNTTLNHTQITTSDVDGNNPSFSLVNDISNAAHWKKVDLVVGKAISLNASLIDVSNKGYPGGINNQYSSVGYGPGHGWGCSRGTRGCSGSGAGYGGHGQNGDLAGGVAYGDASFSGLPANFEWGSGGGGTEGKRVSDGGPGGGRVMLFSDSIYMDSSSFILANGGDGTNDYKTAPGGGSGGSIIISFSKAFVNLHPTASLSSYAVRNPSGNDFGNAAAVGTVHYSSSTLGQENNSPVVNSLYTNIQAVGGASHLSTQGPAGGGGRIYIQQTDAAAKVTIKKTLIPVERKSASPVDNFNPYALQVGDIIQVKLDLGTFSGTVSVEDDYLTAPGSGGSSVACKNDTTRGNPSNVGAADNLNGYVLWTGISSGTSLTYYCKVQ
ncbi:hypothetical protein COT78_01240 [Candidatus Berkelbacteria bacterium CG10_big_fil_rev_8_21_14_0_10_43_13]|uniref:Uncharacterized protein n=1 Tax=Candidatus Berkelbacteria bacterium CG10_big_fil_rev_8_21_14_0_10_43_13 TaxID=1974514 RepID=A0A2H0W6Y5_9BACT|nr:MAG: hypothetical protein COT78_01240 [Candidatus Berkelbacteria bacterium CG10_big_fil_rev_8_21_14_0_10_43_13]